MEVARSRTFENIRVAALVEVAFRSKKEIDPNRPSQFDFAAEEVEKGSPDLVIRDLPASSSGERLQTCSSLNCAAIVRG